MSQASRKIQASTRGSDTSVSSDLLLGYDRWLIMCCLLMLGIGLVMVATASVAVADRTFADPMHYMFRQGIAVVLGLLIAFVMMKTPLNLWQQASPMLLILALVLLILVLIPGLGHEVNGSRRWLNFGLVTVQASEPVKLCVIMYLAGYLVRHGDQVRSEFIGFIKPIGVVTVIAALLLLEPDFGTTAVMFATVLGMLFMGGVPLLRFIAWGLVAVAALITVAVEAPYRVVRMMTFMDPFADPFNSGFQLVQALIAFGRGEWFGVGLGNSIQKLFYLPEAHTDFIFSIVAEEFGLIGSILLIILFTFVVLRAFQFASVAEKAGNEFSAYLAYGIGLMIGLQAFINMGVNMGVLPTKGLTLPLISYGSNSLVVTCASLGLLLRIAFEGEQASEEAQTGRMEYVV